MSETEDLRVRRTKRMLSEAFVKLLEEKPLDDITVNELCDTAGVRRATFYKHYSDKFDFITAYTCSLRDEFDHLIWKSDMPTHTKEYYVAYAKRAVSFISEHGKAVDNIYNSNLFPSFLSIIVEQNYKDTCDRLRASVKAGMKLNASVEVTASMCAGGVSATIYTWLRGGKKEDPDVLAEQVGAVVAAAIEHK